MVDYSDESYIKELENIVRLLLDGIAWENNLSRITGLSNEECSRILAFYHDYILKGKR